MTNMWYCSVCHSRKLGYCCGNGVGTMNASTALFSLDMHVYTIHDARYPFSRTKMPF